MTNRLLPVAVVSISCLICAVATADDLPDFPAKLRHAEPVAKIEDAIVYTMNESIQSDYGLSLARNVDSDVLVRACFKWNHAQDHGTLSNPAYREYLLSWCRRQIDAGIDYLFMDEINAALQPNEGFDDYSIADFRDYLIREFVEGQGWKADDPRWQQSDPPASIA